MKKRSKEEEITHEWKKTLRSFKRVVENLEKRVKSALSKNLLKISRIEGEVSKGLVELTQKAKVFSENIATIKEALFVQKEGFNGIEDTFFTLYHHIKKNQFLYVDDPEEWWNNYLDLKRHYKEKNKKGVKNEAI